MGAEVIPTGSLGHAVRSVPGGCEGKIRHRKCVWCVVCESQHSACQWKVSVVANGLLEKPSISVLSEMLSAELRPCAGTCFCFGSAHLCFLVENDVPGE